MADNGVVCSMSRSGNVWDNAAMESFFSSLKTERTGRKTYRTRDEARADVRVPRASRRELAASARLSAKCKRRHLRIKMKELMALAAGLPTNFQDREDGAAGGLASYRLYQRSLDAGGPLRITKGAVTDNGTSKTRAKNARFDARERRTYST